MAFFLKLTKASRNAGSVYVNMDAVTFMTSHDSETSHTTVLTFDNENTVVVLEDVDQIIAMLDGSRRVGLPQRR